MPTYYNQNTKAYAHTAEPNARLEALPQWQQVDDDPDGPVAQAAARAEAERKSIEEADAIRRKDATKYHEEALQISEASAAQSGGVANVTLASTLPEGYKATEGVLARAKGDQAEGRLQIGPDPEQHPRTREELEAKAQADSERIAALAPEQSSVLERAGVDDGIPEPKQADPDESGPDRTDRDVEEDAEEEEAEEEGPAQPAKSASVGEWRTYAVEARDADADEVAGMTKSELISRYGQ